MTPLVLPAGCAGIRGRELKAAQVALEYARKLGAAVAAKDRESMQIAMRDWRAFAGTGAAHKHPEQSLQTHGGPVALRWPYIE
jgi:hypothetical protein